MPFFFLSERSAKNPKVAPPVLGLGPPPERSSKRLVFFSIFFYEFFFSLIFFLLTSTGISLLASAIRLNDTGVEVRSKIRLNKAILPGFYTTGLVGQQEKKMMRMNSKRGILASANQDARNQFVILG